VHGIPADFDPSVFVGATLATVTFGPYKVDLTFEGDTPLRIAVESAYVHAGPEHEGWRDEASIPVGESRLMQLTNHRVVDARRVDDARLTLVFEHGHSLTLIDDSDQYESFQIEARGQFWII